MHFWFKFLQIPIFQNNEALDQTIYWQNKYSWSNLMCKLNNVIQNDERETRNICPKPWLMHAYQFTS